MTATRGARWEAGASGTDIESDANVRPPVGATWRVGPPGWPPQGSSKVGTGAELRAGSAGIEGILPSLEGGTPSIPGYSRRPRDQYGETQTPDGDF